MSIFRCYKAPLWEGPSVRPAVRPSVQPSVRRLVRTLKHRVASVEPCFLLQLIHFLSFSPVCLLISSPLPVHPNCQVRTPKTTSYAQMLFNPPRIIQPLRASISLNFDSDPFIHLFISPFSLHPTEFRTNFISHPSFTSWFSASFITIPHLPLKVKLSFQLSITDDW